MYFLQFWAEGREVNLTETVRECMASAKTWQDRYNNYKHALLYTIRRGKRGIHKYYAGWDVFVKMAGGNIRYLLELVDQSFLAHLEKDAELRHPIDPMTQTKTAQNVGKKNLSELEGLTIHGAQLTKLLLGLGRIFQVMAAEAKGHTPELNQFSITNTDGLAEAEKTYVAEVIRAAVMHLALVRTPGNKLQDPGDTKDYDYMVHPVFSAFFEYSYRRKRKFQLDEKEIYDLIHKPKVTIRRILERNNRLQEEGLPKQLLLFQTYYEGS